MKHLGLIISLCLASMPALAGDKIYVHSSNQIALVDMETKQSTALASPTLDGSMTDMATDASGNLYLLTFNALYRYDLSTQKATKIGNHGITGANALAFDSNGRLLAASFSNTNLYQIDPTTAQSSTVGSLPVASAGDLALMNGRLLLAGSNDTLGLINLRSGTSSIKGSFGLATSVFGLATGDSNILYGGANSKLFKVDPSNGAVSYLFDMPSSFGQINGMANFKAAAGRDEDRIMNWAEDHYGSLFAPAFSASRRLGDYYYRYYADTGSMLAFKGDRIFYYTVGSAAPADLGLMSNFLPMAAAAGY